MKKIYNLDVANKPLGRAASEAASILRGKNDPAFQPNVAPKIDLWIKNVDLIKINPKKLSAVKYKSFSGYPSGLKETTMVKALAGKGLKYIFHRTVKGMLPKNKLQDVVIKNLHFK